MPPSTSTGKEAKRHAAHGSKAARQAVPLLVGQLQRGLAITE
jgi:hypothetical protein